MAKFDGVRMTQAGEALFTRCMAEGLPLKITRIAIGDGVLMDGQDWYELDGMINEKYGETNMDKRVVSNGVVQLEIIIEPNKITEGFFIRELGVIVENPDGGEILYAYENVGEYADYMPVTRLATYMRRIVRLMVTVANADKVYLTVITEQGQLDCENIGADSLGAGIFARKGADGTLLFKRLIAGEGLEIIEDGDAIVLRLKQGGFA